MSASEADEGKASSERLLDYRPGLDGIRAVAVLAVIGYHGGIRHLPGGFLGVDVFFALSGFLITTLLVAERERYGRIRLGSFVARRARRLLPALLPVTCAIAIYVLFFEPTLVFPSRVETGRWSILYAANWHSIRTDASYFEAFSAPNPYRHLWSLAIEEQWYIVWPPAVAALLWVRRGRVGLALGVAALAAVGSAAVMAALLPDDGDPTRSYYGTDTRAQALLIGALAALAVHRWPPGERARRRISHLAVVAGAVTLSAFVFVSDVARWPYLGGFALVALCATVVVVAAADDASPMARVLSLRPLVWLGSISYGLYLWHWPVHLWLNPDRFSLPFPLIVALRLGVSVALAWMSLALLERPVRNHVRGVPASLAMGAAVVVLALVATTTIIDTRTSDGRVERSFGVGEPPRSPTTSGAHRFHHRAATVADPLRVTLVGDSVGAQIGGSGVPRNVAVTNVASFGCTISTEPYYLGDFRREFGDQCADVASAWRGTASQPTDVVLVFLGSWDVFDRHVDGRRLGQTSTAWQRWFADDLLDHLSPWLDQPSGPTIELVRLPCPATDQLRVGIGAWERTDARRLAAFEGALALVERAAPRRVEIVGYEDVVCDANGRFRSLGPDGERLRPDGLHPDGAAFAAIWRDLLGDIDGQRAE